MTAPMGCCARNHHCSSDSATCVIFSRWLSGSFTKSPGCGRRLLGSPMNLVPRFHELAVCNWFAIRCVWKSPTCVALRPPDQRQSGLLTVDLDQLQRGQGAAFLPFPRLILHRDLAYGPL